MSKKRKRGRPVGSKNKKVFTCNATADIQAKTMIANFGINVAEQLAVRVLEKIRANKARLDEKYNSLTPTGKGRIPPPVRPLPISKED